jgi:DNA-damage-inducible protein D
VADIDFVGREEKVKIGKWGLYLGIKQDENINFKHYKKSKMANPLQQPNQTVFEKIKQVDENRNEYWSARDLSKVLDYAEYRNFLPVIDRAKEACENSGQLLKNHFVDFHEMVSIGSGAERKMESVKLSRYACYLIVQNADPNKEVVALGQTYFAVQTRLQEIRQMDEYSRLKSEEDKRLFLREEMKKHNIHLAEAAKNAGVIEPVDYAIFQNHGYMGLYGGLDAKGIHKKKDLKKNQNILDHMGSTELAANLFRATQTEEKLRRENIQGKTKANQTHFQVGKKVRKTIQELGGTMPENLPVAESIKNLDKKEGEGEMEQNGQRRQK